LPTQGIERPPLGTEIICKLLISFYDFIRWLWPLVALGEICATMAQGPALAP